MSDYASKNVIFHYPIKINDAWSAASHLRPKKIISALEDLGFKVHLMTGTAQERKMQLRQIKILLKNKVKFIGCYSEISTMPTLLTEPHHLPLNPWLDYQLFYLLKKNKIPLSLFYRDIHWKFPHYKKINFLKKLVSTFFYHIDLIIYQFLVTRLYLPHFKMQKFIPILRNFKNIAELPSGISKDMSQVEIPLKKFNNPPNTINLIYVGGIGELYQMQEFLKAFAEICLEFEKKKNLVDPEIQYKFKLNLVTRENEWNDWKKDYLPLIGHLTSEQFEVHHKSGAELAKLMAISHFGLIPIKPTDYWSFVMPMKLFDYLTFRLPLIVTEGIPTSAFVNKYQIGSSSAYDQKSFINCLKNIGRDCQSDPQYYSSLVKNIDQVETHESWKMRALTIVKHFKEDAFN